MLLLVVFMVFEHLIYKISCLPANESMKNRPPSAYFFFFIYLNNPKVYCKYSTLWLFCNNKLIRQTDKFIITSIIIIFYYADEYRFLVKYRVPCTILKINIRKMSRSHWGRCWLIIHNNILCIRFMHYVLLHYF